MSTLLEGLRALGSGRVLDEVLAMVIDSSIEVASWCPPPLLERLVGRGYVTSWFRNVYAMGLDEAVPAPHPHNNVREVGDDTLQKASTGRVVPESFTHGTSAQRQTWFRRGLESGGVQQCNTFDTRTL